MWVQNGDNLLQLSEFIECYNSGVISNVFCIPTYNKDRTQDEKDPTGAIQRKKEADAKAKENKGITDHSNMSVLPTTGLEHHAHLNAPTESPDPDARNPDANVNDAFGQNKPDHMAAAVVRSESYNPNATGPLGAFGAKSKSSEPEPEASSGSGPGPMGAWGK